MANGTIEPTQHKFPWAEDSHASTGIDCPEGANPFDQLQQPPQPRYSDAATPREDGLPIPTPLRGAVVAGVFGQTLDGPIDPDGDDVAAMTEEHANELVGLLGEIAMVEDSIREGRNPRTGKLAKDQDGKGRLARELDAEAGRLKTAYADAIAVYAEAFGEEAAMALDEWTRKDGRELFPSSPQPNDTGRP